MCTRPLDGDLGLKLAACHFDVPVGGSRSHSPAGVTCLQNYTVKSVDTGRLKNGGQPCNPTMAPTHSTFWGSAPGPERSEVIWGRPPGCSWWGCFGGKSQAQRREQSGRGRCGREAVASAFLAWVWSSARSCRKLWQHSRLLAGGWVPCLTLLD